MADATRGQPALSIKHLSKTFPGTRALRDVSLKIAPGTIRGLVGQNGSGKSTLIKTLAGYHRPDQGCEIEVDGNRLPFGNPNASKDVGLRFVHQDLGLIPALNALDNLALGRGYVVGPLGTISWKKEAEHGRRLLEELGIHIDVWKSVVLLSASERTGIAISRAIEGWESGATLLVLDEPTAALPAPEVERLHNIVRTVAQKGVAVLYVSHRFNEMFDIADEVSVLRDGRLVGTWPISSLDQDKLVTLTIGRELVNDLPEKSSDRSGANGEPILSIRGLGGDTLKEVDFDLWPGEILGVAGLTGSGREELAPLLGGALDRRGTVHLGGEIVPANRPHCNVDRGITYVPANRIAEAQLSGMTSRENLTISSLSPCFDLFRWRSRFEDSVARTWNTRLELTPPDPEALIETLSGGNQQRLMFGRSLITGPRVLVLDEPTRGVDVGAKVAIYDLIRSAVAEEAAAIIISIDPEELSDICDRILVVVDGYVASELRGSKTDAESLSKLMLTRAKGAV